MQEQDIKTVLDAGDLTGNYHTLVGFAAGAMGMKAQRVPVADTVAMAKKLGRTNPIGLEPSPLARGTRPDGESCHTAPIQ